MNWKNIIEDLLQRGETISSIALAAKLTPANIRMLMRNPDQQPRWPTGERILSLHSKVMLRYPKIDENV